MLTIRDYKRVTRDGIHRRTRGREIKENEREKNPKYCVKERKKNERKMSEGHIIRISCTAFTEMEMKSITEGKRKERNK